MTQLNHVRYYGLDIVRGLAILCVMLFHFTDKIYDLYPKALPVIFQFSYGVFPVYVFFTLSGFVVLISFKRYSWINFLKIRFIRLYPIFFLGCFITALILFLSPLTSNSVDNIGFLTNLILLNNVLHYPYIDGVYWTLSYEIGFYIFIAFCIGFYGEKIYRYLPILLIMTSIGFIFIAHYIPSPLDYITMITPYSHLFALGIALYLLSTTQDWYNLWYIMPIIFVCFIEYYYNGLIGVLAIVAIIAIVLIGANIKITYNRLTKPLIELGNISYALYIFHQMIGITIIAHLEKIGLEEHISRLITMMIMIIISYYITYYYDAPIGKKLKNLLCG